MLLTSWMESHLKQLDKVQDEITYILWVDKCDDGQCSHQDKYYSNKFDEGSRYAKQKFCIDIMRHFAG